MGLFVSNCFYLKRFFINTLSFEFSTLLLLIFGANIILLLSCKSLLPLKNQSSDDLMMKKMMLWWQRVISYYSNLTFITISTISSSVGFWPSILKKYHVGVCVSLHTYTHTHLSQNTYPCLAVFIIWWSFYHTCLPYLIQDFTPRPPSIKF